MPEAMKIWVSLLDERTTICCLDAHGQTVRIDDLFDTTLGAVDHPPVHWNCRSIVDIDVLNLSELTRPNDDGDRYVPEDRQAATKLIREKRKSMGVEAFERRKIGEVRARVPQLVSYIEPVA